MPNPVPYPDSPNAYGPFRVQMTVTLPDGYEEQWVEPPGGGLPGAMISEVQAALDEALHAEPSATSVTITTHGGTSNDVVSGQVEVGASTSFRGGADPEGAPAAEEATTQVWTAEVFVYAPDSVTSSVLDYAYVAGRWVTRVGQLALPVSEVTAPVLVSSVWLATVTPPAQLDPAYPAGTGRSITVAASG